MVVIILHLTTSKRIKFALLLYLGGEKLIIRFASTINYQMCHTFIFWDLKVDAGVFFCKEKNHGKYFFFCKEKNHGKYIFFL